MRREGRSPLGNRLLRRRADRATVEEEISLVVAPQKIALPCHVDCGRPLVRVHRHKLARRDAHFEDAHALVFKQQLVMLRRGNDGIERIGPRPWLLWLLCARAQEIPANELPSGSYGRAQGRVAFANENSPRKRW